jgi:hypothetical protein
MEKVEKPSKSVYYTPSSEPFRIYNSLPHLCPLSLFNLRYSYACLFDCCVDSYVKLKIGNIRITLHLRRVQTYYLDVMWKSVLININCEIVALSYIHTANCREIYEWDDHSFVPMAALGFLVIGVRDRSRYSQKIQLGPRVKCPLFCSILTKTELCWQTCKTSQYDLSQKKTIQRELDSIMRTDIQIWQN